MYYFMSESRSSFPFLMPGLGSQPSFPSVSSGWQFSRILDSVSVLVILRFSLCHQPFCLCSVPVLKLLSGISFWRFFHQFMLAEVQSCLDLASLSHFSCRADTSNILPFLLSSLPFPKSHTQIAPGPRPSFYPTSLKSSLLPFSQTNLLIRPLWNVSVFFSGSQPCNVLCKEAAGDQTPHLTNLSTPIAP